MAARPSASSPSALASLRSHSTCFKTIFFAPVVKRKKPPKERKTNPWYPYPSRPTNKTPWGGLNHSKFNWMTRWEPTLFSTDLTDLYYFFLSYKCDERPRLTALIPSTICKGRTAPGFLGWARVSRFRSLPPCTRWWDCRRSLPSEVVLISNITDGPTYLAVVFGIIFISPVLILVTLMSDDFHGW